MTNVQRLLKAISQLNTRGEIVVSVTPTLTASEITAIATGMGFETIHDAEVKKVRIFIPNLNV